MFEQMEWDRKYTLLKRLGMMYRNCETQMQLRSGFIVEEEEALYKYLEVKGNIDIALQKLTKEEVLIIQNEYLKNVRANWYIEYFSKQEYIRLMKLASNTFLRCLYG